MEKVDREIVMGYAALLKDRILEGDLAAATGQNYVSAINTVLHAATNWKSINPVADCGMNKRSNIRIEAPASESRIQEAIQSLRDNELVLQAYIAELAWKFGMRSKEASLANPQELLKQAVEQNRIAVSKGTKGGRLRYVPIILDEQLEILRQAAEFQDKAPNLIAAKQAWSVWRDGGLRDGREVLVSFGLTGFHELRAAYACARYHSITGHVAPCVVGSRSADRQEDLDARLVISEELGHGRIDVTVAYLGSVK
jgi:integrase